MFHVKQQKIEKICQSVSHETFSSYFSGCAQHFFTILRSKSDIFEKSERIVVKDLKISAFHGTIGAVLLPILYAGKLIQKRRPKIE